MFTVNLHQGPYKFWKVMNIKNAIFQDVASFGKEGIFKVAMASCEFYLEKLKKYPKMDVALSYYFVLDCWGVELTGVVDIFLEFHKVEER